MQPLAFDVDDPGLRHAMARIELHFGITVVAQRAIADLNDQKGIGPQRMTFLIPFALRLEQRKVRHWLGAVAQTYCALHAHDGAFANRVNEKLSELIYDRSVETPYGRHVDDLS